MDERKRQGCLPDSRQSVDGDVLARAQRPDQAGNLLSPSDEIGWQSRGHPVIDARRTLLPFVRQPSNPAPDIVVDPAGQFVDGVKPSDGDAARVGVADAVEKRL